MYNSNFRRCTQTETVNNPNTIYYSIDKYCIQDTLSTIVARRAWPAGALHSL